MVNDTRENPTECRHSAVVTQVAWLEVKRYLRNRDWSCYAMHVAVSYRRVVLCKEAHDAFESRTDLTLLAIEEKHPVVFELDFAPLAPPEWYRAGRGCPTMSRVRLHPDVAEYQLLIIPDWLSAWRTQIKELGDAFMPLY